MFEKYGLIIISLLIWVTPVWAQGNASAGQAKSTTCAACHGFDGNSPAPAWPKLAGQGEAYLYQQMLDFKKGEAGPRYNAVMLAQVEPLSEQDMQDLAVFYATQTVSPGVTLKKWLARGQQLYRGGDHAKKISACIACHGPRGLGVAQAKFPLLSGQYPEYTALQLQAYKTGDRSNDANQIMQTIASRMDNDDMQAAASYVAGLH